MAPGSSAEPKSLKCDWTQSDTKSVCSLGFWVRCDTIVSRRWLAAGVHVVTPNKRLGSGPVSDYLAAMAETRAGRGMFFGEARLSCCARVVQFPQQHGPSSCRHGSAVYGSHRIRVCDLQARAYLKQAPGHWDATNTLVQPALSSVMLAALGSLSALFASSRMGFCRQATAGAGLPVLSTLHPDTDFNPVRVCRQATVGAGLPVLSTLQTLRATGDRVARIEGVLSGTLSYLFNTFAPGQRFSALVADARRQGFTEPDPRDDLSGMKFPLKRVCRMSLLTTKRLLTKNDKAMALGEPHPMFVLSECLSS